MFGVDSGGSIMSSLRISAAFLLSAALLAPSAFATHVHRSPTSGKSSSHNLSRSRRKARKTRGQQAIEPERVTQIQQALIHVHYLNSDANGKWDATTVAAMQKFQADNGWQTRLMPDSRALMKLGLGPDYSTAINAKGSSFTAPVANSAAVSADSEASSASTPQDAGFIAASGVSQ